MIPMVAIATGHGIQGLPIAPARGVLGDEARPHGVLGTEYDVGDYITTDIDGNVHVGKVLSVDKGTKTVQVQLLVGGASGAEKLKRTSTFTCPFYT